MSGSENARDRIRKAAVELMGRKGIAGATTQDIARRARCSQAAIYKHWDGKEALAHATFRDANGRLIEAMEAGAATSAKPSERVVGSLVGLLRFARANPDEHAFMFHVFHSEYAKWLVAQPKPRDIVLRELGRAAEQGTVPAGSVSTRAALLLGMVVRLAFFERQGLLDGNPEEAETALRQAAASVLTG